MRICQLIPQKITVFAIFLSFFSHTLSAQQSDLSSKSRFWERTQFGGGLGLSFGDGFFAGTIAPSGIYNVNDYVAFGVGLNATFNNRDNFYKSTILGGSLISLFQPIRDLQLSTEFEQLHVERNWDDPNIRDEDYWYPALFLGAGYRNGNITFGLRYDVLYDDDKSIYSDPWMPFVRVYF